MKWEKRGIIFNPKGVFNWSKHSALQPTPLVFESFIRIYFGSRDEHGVSRIGFIDCDIQNPEKIIQVSEKPVLDIGEDGCFDDNGVVPCAIIRKGKEIWMYYAGYQLTNKVRFMVLGGLAISVDEGLTFNRYLKTPILERTSNETLFRVIHTVLQENEIYKVWYGGGNHFIKKDDKSFPVYDIRYMESSDGIHFPNEGQTIIQNEAEEYRVGRPYVCKINSKYYMFFGASTPQNPYRLDYAISQDGNHWIRSKENFGLMYHFNDPDSEMSAYPAVVSTHENTWLFYNGNNYGENGIILANLISI